MAAAWLGPLPPLAPLATRRTRLLEVGAPDDSGHLPLLVRFSDSYADPDGIHRALHEWSIRTTYSPADDRFGALGVSPGRLPWVECPSAGASAVRLDGLTTAEVDAALTSEFGGISACTHLTDTLRTLVDVADVAALSSGLARGVGGPS
jgi:hypothetical protein